MLAFFGLTVAVFVAALAVTSTVRYQGWPLLAYLTQHLVEPGGRYHSLRRFGEVDDHGSVDIVFFGSSHAYRGFDPRLFAEAGYRAYNLGSTNQTPLNSYFLAQRHLPQLNPRLAIVEIYYATLAGDGFESTRDLLVNTSWSWDMQRMAFATRHLGAIDYGLSKGLGFIGDIRSVAQRDIEGERYVAGGYVETGDHRRELTEREPFTVEISPRQIDWLQATTRWIREAGTRVVWVTHPLPRDHREALDNYESVHQAIRGAAQRAQVDYWSFDGRLQLDPREHFADFHHLDAEGVAIFNRALIAELRDEGYLD